MEDLVDYLGKIRFRHKRIVNIYHRDAGLYGKMHAEVLVELFKSVYESTAVDQDKAFLGAGASERCVNIKFKRVLSIVVLNVHLCPALSRKNFFCKSRCIKSRAVPDEDLSFLFCPEADERFEHGKPPFRFVTPS